MDDGPSPQRWWRLGRLHAMLERKQVVSDLKFNANTKHLPQINAPQI